MPRRICILGANGHNNQHKLVPQICEQLTKICKTEITPTKKTLTCFANAELLPRIDESVRGCDVFVVLELDGEHPQQLNNAIWDLILTIDAAKRAAADENGDGRVFAIMPCMPYARQDQTRGRESLTLSVIANMLKSVGANGVITYDLHSDGSEGNFSGMLFENMHASAIIVPHLRPIISGLGDVAVAVPDVGGSKKGSHYADAWDLPLVICDKKRDYSQANKVVGIDVIGDVKPTMIIFDDMIDTAGTQKYAIQALVDRGAKKVIAVTVHLLLNGKALKRLSELHSQGILSQVIGTDSVIRSPAFFQSHPFIEHISLTELTAEAIAEINKGDKGSISRLYKLHDTDPGT